VQHRRCRRPAGSCAAARGDPDRDAASGERVEREGLGLSLNVALLLLAKGFHRWDIDEFSAKVVGKGPALVRVEETGGVAYSLFSSRWGIAHSPPTQPAPGSCALSGRRRAALAIRGVWFGLAIGIRELPKGRDGGERGNGEPVTPRDPARPC
jgi:hypothetical protein